jgi:hypothetical protein
MQFLEPSLVQRLTSMYLGRIDLEFWCNVECFHINEISINGSYYGPLKSILFFQI